MSALPAELPADLPGDSTLSTFTASDGDNLAVQDWPLPEGVARRGMVVIVHGLGEHAGRYDRVARRLNQWGFAVRGYDQYGHGESDGVRGALPTATRLLDDLADIVDSTRTRMEPGLPLILLGHSMGGLVAATFVAQILRPVDALVLTSPALDAGLSRFQRLLLGILPRIAPNFTVDNGLEVQAISHDPEVVRAYQADPRVHGRISGRLARFIADGGPAVVAQAPHWHVPTLLMYAGSDRLVNPAGSRSFAQAAPAAVVESHCFEPLYHEILNEPEELAAPVFERLKTWLDERLQAA
jgi:alpha-beta hydrolase superfamily lysophospholipase